MNPKKTSATWTFVFATLIVPLGDSTDWMNLKFKGISQNQVEFSKDHLKISVRESASPLFYVFKTSETVTAFKVTGRWVGDFKVPAGKRQGERGFDDFVFRLGFVVPGKHTLSVIQKLFAPEWLKKVFSLAPKGEGIDRVEFFNAVVDSKNLGLKRNHPLNDLIKENYTWEMSAPKDFSFGIQLSSPLVARALWVSSDGDDTKSRYELSISNISIDTEGSASK